MESSFAVQSHFQTVVQCPLDIYLVASLSYSMCCMENFAIEEGEKGDSENRLCIIGKKSM